MTQCSQTDSGILIKKIQPKIHERVHINDKNEDLDEKTDNLRKSLGLPPLKSKKVNQKDCESVHEDENLSDATVHEEKKLFKCSGCNFSAPEIESVTKHVKEIHQAGPPKVAKKLFKCSECSYSHLNNENVIMHIKVEKI